MNFARALFAPRAIALVGASGDIAKNTARPQRFLKAHGYEGRVFPINPTRDKVLGLRAYPSVADAPEGIEHVFVMAPGDAVERALEDCGRRRIPVMSIFSDGFADAGPAGAARQERFVARAKELGVRVLGPNSMGLINIPGRVALTVNAVLEMESLIAGTTSIVSQSGTMIGTVLSRGAARGLGFSKLISVGNEADLGVGELVDLLADDDETRVILLFLETVRDASRLAAAARRAQAAGKPVVAFKLGRSQLGEALAHSHTGALAGSDAALDAYFRDCGILRVEMLETLVEIAPLVSGRAAPNLQHAPRIAVVTTTGGGAASVVDRMGTLGINALGSDAALRERLTNLGVRVSDSPIIDLTMAATTKQYSAVLSALLESPACDGVLAVVGSSAQFHPQLAVEPILATPRGSKPLAAFLTPNAERSLALLAEKNIPAFRTPEACADAFAAYFNWRSPRMQSNMPETVWPANIRSSGKLNEAESLALFASLGATTVASAVAKAPDYAHAIPYPVAAKILSADIAHKTDAGGVALDLRDADDFALRVRAMLVRVKVTQPDASIEGVLVQRMETGLAEAIVGYRHDEMVGPLVMVGAGGALAEIYKDTAIRLAPVSEAEAHEMIAEVKGLAVIRGYRNLPQGDVAALARMIVAISRLALVKRQPVAEAEMNPVIVKREGAVAVDGLVVFRD